MLPGASPPRIPRHVAIIMDGNGAGRPSAGCRGRSAIIGDEGRAQAVEGATRRASRC
jgi:undecaprenyl pyrophosphate synthase